MFLIPVEIMNSLKEAAISLLIIAYFKLILKLAVYTQNIWFFSESFKNEVWQN